ncbi:LacI family DNA-binding transcriptional regulator [Propionibacterium freudenreichii]|uniref:LacI family DNA-binding transcriptional regulator n=1 Tax=Propionibacterium freudenreichii TaxID=1744 RepID=UPI0005A5CBC0|nr:LacI family DNA-binding transcriptional regulator [Propionibacterium freudenreichii]CEI48616.1 Transcriptional regulator, LacI family (HTH-type transcriptional regulator degA) [Propionibacterium freudenreichii]
MAADPTQRDVARAAGVSRGLVSLALSGSSLVADDTRERIVQVAHELGYTRNLGAASLASKRSPVVGVVLPDLRNPFFESVVDNLQHEADGLGLLPLVATSADDRSRETTVLQRFRELRAAGIVMVSPVEGPEAFTRIGSQLPLVLIGAALAGDGFDSVHVDEDAAAALIVEHLRGHGWRRIVAVSFVSGLGEVWVAHRHRALARAAAAAGMPLERVEVPRGEALAPQLGGVLAAQADQRVAVVTHNDLTAADVLAFVRARGLRPGYDLAVIGFDDTHMARRPEFDITSVSQNTGELARLAMVALQGRAEWMGARALRRHPDVAEGDDEPLRGREFIVAPALSVRSSS